MDLLRDVTLFDGLAEEQLARIEAICEELHLPEDHILSLEGNIANDIYILLDGSVGVSKKLRLPSIEPLEGEDKTLTILTADKRPVIGETALVGGTHRLATLRCKTACRVLKLNALRLNQLLDADPDAGLKVFRNLTLLVYRRLEAANNDVVKLSAALVYALES